MGPYISRTRIRDSRVIRQGPSGSVGPYRVPTGFRRNLVLARRDPTRLDGSLDCPVSVHDSCTDPYGTLRRLHGPSGGPSGPDGPPADRRRHRRTPFHRRLPGLGGPQLLLASAVAIVELNCCRRVACLLRQECCDRRAKSCSPRAAGAAWQCAINVHSSGQQGCQAPLSHIIG